MWLPVDQGQSVTGGQHGESHIATVELGQVGQRLLEHGPGLPAAIAAFAVLRGRLRRHQSAETELRFGEGARLRRRGDAEVIWGRLGVPAAGGVSEGS